MPERGKRAVLLLAAGVVCVAGGLSPWVYDAVRTRILVRKLEQTGDEWAARELAHPRYVEALRARLVETGSANLADPLLELARAGSLEPAARRDVFERIFPTTLRDGTGPPAAVPPKKERFPGQRITLLVTGTLASIDAAGPWTAGERAPPAAPRGGGVIALVEYFIEGTGEDGKCLYQRRTWIVYPETPPPGGPRYRVETADETGDPDPLNMYIAPPGRARLADGREAVELRFASLGTWRQWVRGRKLFDHSVSYAVRVGSTLLFRAAVSAETGLGKWFAEDAVEGKEIEGIQLGAHWIRVRVPLEAIAARPLEKLRLTFEADPAFGEKHGFSAPAEGSPRFEREHYLPPFGEE